GKQSPATGNQPRGSEPQTLPVHPWSRRYGHRRCRSDGAQIVRRGFAGPAIGDNFEGDLLPLVKSRHSGAFDRTDMHEDILAAIVRLNEAEALLAVKPLYGSRRHGSLSSGTCVNEPRVNAAGSYRDWGECRQTCTLFAARPS